MTGAIERVRCLDRHVVQFELSLDQTLSNNSSFDLLMLSFVKMYCSSAIVPSLGLNRLELQVFGAWLLPWNLT